MATMNDLLLACTIGDVPWLKRGLSRGLDPNSRTREGENGFHLAAKHGMFECMKYLLEHHISNVNDQVLTTGDTALHCVLAGKLGKKTIKFVRFLLDNGGEIDRQNKTGQTPLHFAARHGKIKSLKLLLDCGADIHKIDNDGNTACDLACLHGKHECARLLRALHWAKKKDTDLDTKLKKERIRKTQEREYRALHSRLKREAADCAFEAWLEQKELPWSPTPGACEERRDFRSRNSHTTSCTMCTQATSKAQSANSKLKSPKVTSQIKLNHHQEAHNVDSVGKPKKLYPYSNYPPKHLRGSSAGQRKSKHAPRSGRSSRATVHNMSQSEPILVHTSPKKTQESAECYTPIEMSKSTVEAMNAVELTSASDGSKPVVTITNESDGSTDLFDLDDEDDDLFFHDVGHANNLEALALPNSIAKDKSKGELIQLLQSLGEPRSKTLNRSHSLSARRNSAHSIKPQRRLSLGAIPEGRMVTSYSDEDLSVGPSQILDESFIEELIRTFDSAQKNEGNKENHTRRIVWNEDSNSACQEDIVLGDVPAFDQETQSSRRLSLTLPLSSSQDEQRNSPTLKVVNMEWDPTSSSVQSIITASPLTPPPDLHQKRLSPPSRLSPSSRTNLTMPQ